MALKIQVLGWDILENVAEVKQANGISLTHISPLHNWISYGNADISQQ
jgi:hypothetical protein